MPNHDLISWTTPSTDAEQAARDLISAVMFLHTTFKDEIWLWRGQANEKYLLEPGMHTRVKSTPAIPNTEEQVVSATAYLVEKAREAGIDSANGTRLPDLALLASLQHYGAATPLLDVSVDPLVALWLVAFASSTEDDDAPGALYAIKKPPPERTFSPLDARPYASKTEASIATSLQGSLWWYRAPDITERLRIQRGSFLIGPLTQPDDHATTLPLTTQSSHGNWLKTRMDRRGKPSNTTRSWTDVVVFRVRKALKVHLRTLLTARSRLDISTIYPTPWERPFIEQFATGYGRNRLIDIPPSSSGDEQASEPPAPSP